MTRMERMQTFAPSTSLRKEPVESAEVVAVLSRDTVLEVFEAAGRFSRVRCMGEGGQVLNGFIIANMLGPVVERNEMQAVPEKPGKTSWFTLIRSTLSGANSLLAAGLVILLITNLVTTFILWRNIKELQNRSVHVSCSGTSGRAVPLWGTYDSVSVDPDYFESGKVKFFVRYQVMEKLPGSSIVLRYRHSPDEEWKEQPMQESDKPLNFMATFTLAPDARLEYQALQRLNGENLRVDRENHTEVVYVAGNGDVECFLTKISNSQSKLSFRQRYSSRVTALQVEKIIVEIDQKNPQLLTLTNSGSAYELTALFQNDGFKGMKITVIYRDGEERVAEFGPTLPVPAVIKR